MTRELVLLLEEGDFAQEVIQPYAEYEPFAEFLETHSIDFLQIDPVNYEGPGLMEGVPNWLICEDQIPKKHLLGRPAPQDLISELITIYGLD